jgi:hypothetical protein
MGSARHGGTMPSSQRQISDAKPHLQRVDDNAFHLHVLREARSKSNSAVTKKKTSFELAPRDREFACHKPDLLS